MISVTYPAQRLRRTKIMCTIGPAAEAMIGRLMIAGMDVARLNFAHGTYEQHARYIRAIRESADRLGVPVAIIQDLPGPKNRTGGIGSDGVYLRDGEEFVLTTRGVPGDEREVSTSLDSLPRDVRPGNTIFLDDGAIELVVIDVSETDVRCRVVVGGLLRPERGINVPGVTLSVPSVTEQDLRHLSFGLEQGVDFVALSFVRGAQDVLMVRDLISRQGRDVPIIAKIEKHEALDNFDGILAAADGIMVARGDLGVEIEVQRVPVVQKDIVRRCNHVGKPVIVATQMLESMVNSPRPTRAEVADVANAIYDGADAVMLSEETAVGRFPVQATRMMAQIAIETEKALPYEQILQERGAYVTPQTDEAIAFDACSTAQRLGAGAIVAFTSSGSTARRVSKYRPRVPIIAITPSETVRKMLSISWGVYSCQVPHPPSVDALFKDAARVAREMRHVATGDLVVITAGVPIGVTGSTNLLKVEQVE